MSQCVKSIWHGPFYILNESGRMFATELIRRMRPIIFRSMSSSVLPCVSGTLNIMKNRPAIQIVENIQKSP